MDDDSDNIMGSKYPAKLKSKNELILAYDKFRSEIF